MAPHSESRSREVGHDTTRPLALNTTAPAVAPQDYSPVGMFTNEHTQFLNSMNRFEPAIRARFRGLPDASVNGEAGDFDSAQYGVKGSIPIILDPDSLLRVGGEVEARRFETSTNFGAGDETVWTVGLEVGYGRFFAPDLYGEVTFAPGIYSDFDTTLGHSDWQFFGTGLMTFQYNENLFFKGGIEVSELFDDSAVYPLIGLSSLFHPNWRTDILLPRKAEVAYLPDAATTVFLGLSLDGDEFEVRSSTRTGQRHSEIQSQELELYLGADYRFDDNLSVYGKFGAVLGGHNKFKTPTSVDIDGQLDPTIMFEFGLGWDF